MARTQTQLLHTVLLALVLAALSLGDLAACANTSGGASMEEQLKRLDSRLDESIPEMTDCFRRELGSEADLINGRIVILFEVAEDGLVSTLEVLESELKSSEASLCVSDTIRRIYFAEWVGRNPVRLTKSFQFVAGR